MKQKRMRSETKWKAASKVYIIKQVSTVCIRKFLIHMGDFENYCRIYVSVFSNTRSKRRDFYSTMDIMIIMIHLVSI